MTQTLLNGLRGGRLAHALLLTGPRGTGKTSTARILAKSLRCPNAKDFVPCNECAECADISGGRSINVIEIDGASNNGVDAIRELRDTVSYMPSSGTYKLYIIDEVHMLSTSAFNALLKTLEEPPPHVIFVLATTEVQKIPNTILSRCQRLDFRRISSREVMERLKLICDQESVESESEALWMIARQAEGSMRDSQSLLDQVITYSDKHITVAQVVDVLGLTDRALLLETLQALVARDGHRALKVIEQLFISGFDPKVFAQDLLEELRHLLMVKVAQQVVHDIVDLPDTEIESLRQLATQLSEEDIHLLFDMALKGGNDIPRAQDPRIVLEMMLLRMTGAPRIESLAQWAQGVNSTTAAPMRPAVAAISAPPTMATPVMASTPAPTPTSTAPLAKLTGSLEERWFQFVEHIHTQNALLAAKMAHARVVHFEPSSKNLLVAIPANMKFLFEQLQGAQFKEQLSQLTRQLWEAGTYLTFKLDDGAAQTLSPKAFEEKKKSDHQSALKEQIENNPFVKSIGQVFKAEIKSIKERP